MRSGSAACKVWPLGAGGEAAVVRMLELLEDEVTRCLGLLGVTSFAELDPSYVAPVAPLGRALARQRLPAAEGRLLMLHQAGSS